MKRHSDGAVLGVELNAGHKQRQDLGLLPGAERVPDVVEIGERRGNVLRLQSLAFRRFNLLGPFGKLRLGLGDPFMQVGNAGCGRPVGRRLDGEPLDFSVMPSKLACQVATI